MRQNKKIFAILTVFLPLVSLAMNTSVNGFASFFARQSLTEDIYDYSLNPGEVDYSNSTRIGLNVRSNINEDWSIIGQLVASQRTVVPSATPPDWSPRLDWIYLNFTPEDNWTFRFGRQLLPTAMTAEYVDVGLIYPWRKLPSQYFIAAIPFKWFEGASAEYQMNFAENILDFKLYTGSSKPSNEPGMVYNVQIRNLIGGAVSFENDGLRLQASLAHYKLILTSPTDPPVPLVEFDKYNLVTGLGMYYEKNNIVFYAESGRNSCGDNCGSQAYYSTLGYRIKSFLPYFMLSQGDLDAADFSADLKSETIGLNYQISPSMVLKTEFLRQEGNDAGSIPTYLTSKSRPVVDGRAESYAIGLDVVF